MAENKGIMLAKSMQKHAGRAKEKILQNLGKVDRTADEIFDDHLNNFNRQQASASRLQKEFNNYIRCIRAAQTASKSLMDAVCEVYEPQWSGYDALQAQSAASESLWQDFAHKLGDQVLIPLNTYTGQFPEMKKKVEKRNRKLIDYDGQRHSFQSLQANANKRKDDVKLTKGREQLEEARRTYEILNTELHDELPALYDSRILFLVTNLQTLFATEQVFHNETSKIYSELEAIVDKLATDSQRGSNTLRKQTTNAIISSSTPVQSPVKQMNNSNMNNSNYQNQITTNGSSNANSPTSSSSEYESRLDSISPTPESTPENLNAANNAAATSAPSSPASAPHPMKQPAKPTYQNVAAIIDAGKMSPTPTPIPTPTTPTAVEIAVNKAISNDLNSPNANTTIGAAVEEKHDELKEKLTNNTASTAVTAAKLSTTTATTTTTTTKTTTLKGSKIPNAINAIERKEQLNGNSKANGNEHDGSGAATTAAANTNGNDNGNNGNTIDDNKKSLGKDIVDNPSKIVMNSSDVVHKNPFDDDDERIYEVPNDATTADLPPGVLYRVKATYGYVKEDVDELSFEIGDTIRVIEYDDPEDQEEGWLMGEKEGTTEKGLFPANFTRPI